MSTLCVSVLTATLCLLSPGAGAENIPIVTAIEAVYLTKFPPFIDWPDNGHQGATRRAICILGNDQIAAATVIAESRAMPAGPPMAVRRIVPGQEAAGCKILFLGNADNGSTISAGLATVATSPTLTITDQAGGDHRGIINFVIKNDRVRFEIDDAEAARHGLKISSKLLNVAVSVKPRSQ